MPLMPEERRKSIRWIRSQTAKLELLNADRCVALADQIARLKHQADCLEASMVKAPPERDTVSKKNMGNAKGLCIHGQ